MTYQLHHGNCIDIMPLIERESVDAVICDPPYGLGFMGKDWDHGVPGEHFWREVYRCAKPGAYLLAFGGTRTFHRLAVAIEDAGWEIRDTVMWVYGQGFPKSHDVSKAIDREAGADREVIEGAYHHGGLPSGVDRKGDRNHALVGIETTHDRMQPMTQPATLAAVEWDGWGTALKPAWEPILVARKPLQGTVAENVQRYGTGAMNIDACRIEIDDVERDAVDSRSGRGWGTNQGAFLGRDEGRFTSHPQGRWPANLIHDGSAEVLAGFPQAPSAGHYKQPDRVIEMDLSDTNINWRSRTCNIRSTSKYSGDTGSAARFFKSCPPDDICLLCFTPKHDKMSAWKSILAHNAEKHGWTTQATNEFIARMIAIGSQSESLAQSVKSAASLCASCETLIVIALAGIKTSAFSAAELQVILDCIGSYKNSTLTQSLVFFAESQGSTDITQTMISLLKSSGCANHVTTNFTPETKRLEQSRFIYTAKASKADRDEGLEGFEEVESGIGDERPSGQSMQRLDGRESRIVRNHHPTVKPTSLMRYLCRLVTPPQGVILDPFMGSGSTGKAAMLEGFNFIGIDTEIEYVEIAARRIEHACEKVGIAVEQPMMFETQRETVDRPKQLMLL